MKHITKNTLIAAITIMLLNTNTWSHEDAKHTCAETSEQNLGKLNSSAYDDAFIIKETIHFPNIGKAKASLYISKGRERKHLQVTPILDAKLSCVDYLYSAQHLTLFSENADIFATAVKKLRDKNYTVEPSIHAPYLARIFIDPATPTELMTTLAHLTSMFNEDVSVELDPIMLESSFNGTPNDPTYYRQWHLERIEALDAWRITTGSPDVKLAFIDTGFDIGNTEFQGRSEYVYLNGNGSTQIKNSHGTYTASIGAAKGNNGVDGAGIDWNCKLLFINIDQGLADESASKLAEAINLAVSKGANVISISMGYWASSIHSADKRAIDDAIDAGVTIVASVGNESATTIKFPARYRPVIAVGAVDSNNNKWEIGSSGGSNSGPEIDFVAPGGNIYLATHPDNAVHKPAFTSGTSFATPMVAGTITLLLSVDPDLSPTEIYDALRAGSSQTTHDNDYGWGHINIYKSLASVIPVNGTITYTADAYCDVYLNGSYLSNSESWDRKTTTKFEVRPGMNQIVIIGQDYQGRAGVLADIQLENGLRFVTDHTWQAFNMNSWRWESATTYGNYGVAPWGKRVSNFPQNSSAKWIWGHDNFNQNDIYLRKYFYVE